MINVLKRSSKSRKSVGHLYRKFCRVPDSSLVTSKMATESDAFL